MDEGAGIAGAIAAILFVGFALLPVLVVGPLFLFFTIMGLIHGTAFRAGTLNLTILFIGLAVIVTTFVVLVQAGVALIGRGLTPKRRRRR
jgi:hypothetical protein